MSGDHRGPVLRWGLLGTARINRMVIPPLRASARNRLEAVASRTPRRAEEYAREWGIARAFGSYEALLADPAIDAVYIALPNALHAEWSDPRRRGGQARPVREADGAERRRGRCDRGRRGTLRPRRHRSVHVPAPPAERPRRAPGAGRGDRRGAADARVVPFHAHAARGRALAARDGRRLPVGRRVLPGELRAHGERNRAGRGQRRAGARPDRRRHRVLGRAAVPGRRRAADGLELFGAVPHRSWRSPARPAR